MLSPEELAKIERTKEKFGDSSLHFVKVLPFSTIQDSGRLSLALPNLSCRPTFYAKDVQYSNDSEFRWLGNIDKPVKVDVSSTTQFDISNASLIDTTCWDGSIVLNCKQGELSGYIHISDNWYELYSFRGDTSLLIDITSYALGFTEVCPGLGVDVDTASVEHDRHNQIGGLGRSASTTSACPVKILALYTQGASDASFNVTNYITSSIDQANLALANSQINASLTEYDLVGVRQLASGIYNPTGQNIRDANNDLTSFANNQNVIDLRNETGAVAI